MLPRLALLALMTIPLAACDGQAMTDFRRTVGLEEAEPEQPAGPRPPAVSPLEQPIETGAAEPRPIPTVEPLTYRSTAFVAGGNEPFWNVQINGDTATYRTPEDSDGRRIQVNRVPFDDGVEYIGVLNGRPFALNLRAERCRDSMSGKRMPLTARLTVTGDQFTGCGAPAQPAAATTAAPAGPAPAG
ncbi:COG3650 family protein [Paracoccus beibuensis]|uniref:COG3650 family protein n=1 Tax=Paracoccus beibuensis TaxID=547602 RepID=UPI00223FA66A|nr:hypothetical protein [Paracoccus beibuensis]